MYSNHFKDITNHNGSKIALNSFIKQKLSQYSSKRNYDFGDPNLNYVSVLSPAIRMRILTEINIIHEVKKYFNYNVIGCDTLIYLENKIFDKAKNKKEAVLKIKKLSGKKHKIISSLTLSKLLKSNFLNDISFKDVINA